MLSINALLDPGFKDAPVEFAGGANLARLSFVGIPATERGTYL
jgi:hypothetical protein